MLGIFRASDTMYGGYGITGLPAMCGGVKEERLKISDFQILINAVSQARLAICRKEESLKISDFQILINAVSQTGSAICRKEENMINTGVFDYINVLDKAADASWLRHEAISNNIANATTPGYKRQDVAFESQLRKALGNCVHKSMDEKVGELKAGEQAPVP